MNWGLLWLFMAMLSWRGYGMMTMRKAVMQVRSQTDSFSYGFGNELSLC